MHKRLLVALARSCCSRPCLAPQRNVSSRKRICSSSPGLPTRRSHRRLDDAAVRVTVNEKENRYETSHVHRGTTGAEAARRLTSNVRDTMPRWSPDGGELPSCA
jgi:hypothetical protein